MYYYRARFYDPATGRFVQEDPIAFAGGDPNLYRYVGNRPQLLADPLGYTALSESAILRKARVLANQAARCLGTTTAQIFVETAIKSTAEFGIYIIVEGAGRAYVGKTTRQFKVRIGEHERAGRTVKKAVGIDLSKPKLSKSELKKVEEFFRKGLQNTKGVNTTNKIRASRTPWKC